METDGMYGTYGPRVLVVDDEEAVLDIVNEFLTLEGYVVRPVGSAEAALKVLKTEPFDLILTDLKMPDMDGIELIRRIRAWNPDPVLVMMTGFGTVETAIEAMKLGAFDYILKPFKPDDVLLVLQRALEKRQLRRENISLRETLNFYELSEALSSDMSLDEQLKLMAQMVHSNLGADYVSIDIQDPKNPNTIINSVKFGHGRIEFLHDVLTEELLVDQKVLVNGQGASKFIDGTSLDDRRVHCFMASPLKLRGATFGALSACSFDPGTQFSEGQRKGMAILGGRVANAIATARMYTDLENTLTQTMEGFARALEAKDAYTHGHSDRVAMYSKLIAQAMGLPPLEVDRIQHGGFMHDIGKIGIRADELSKPQKLTPDEYRLFKTHPLKGRRIIEPINFLRHLVPCVYHHHEAWDGSGYPEGLAGEAIPLEARILAVADTYDAMTSNRPYRKALPHMIAIKELRSCVGRKRV